MLGYHNYKGILIQEIRITVFTHTYEDPPPTPHHNLLLSDCTYMEPV
jgi:hypothetical protein